MAEIKSAFEIAMERADRIGKLSREELAEREWAEKGRKKAADFLAGRTPDMKTALSDVPGEMLRTVIRSASDTLLRNIVLPREHEQWDGIEKAMQGIAELKGSVAMQVIPGIRELLQQYEQTRNQYLEQFKAQMDQAMQSAGQYGGMGGSGGGPDMNTIAAMQKEWDKISAELNSQFEQQLEPALEYLRQI
jgi:hypothetical protein